MHKLTAHDAETQSLDGVADNIAKLGALFPEILTEGADGGKRLDFAALRELLGDAVEDKEERYHFTWHGKAQSRRLALTPSTGTLRPCVGESKQWDSTQNLFIEGDNLEVLKLLQKPYHQRVKMIYIDPPYNTGKDFIYPDNYRDNIGNYLELTGQVEDGRKMGTNTETSGRYHTNWLNMMYPRLKLARNLLREDGVIFISIDDTEVANLRKLCDEIFGEENFVTQLVWAGGRKNDSKLVSVSHEYIVCYVKNIAYLNEQKIIWRQRKKGLEEIYAKCLELQKSSLSYAEMTTNLKEWYKELPNSHPSKSHKHYNTIDARGVYFPSDISWPGGGGPKYTVLHPVTKQPVKIPSRGWVYSDPQRMQQAITDDLVHFGEDENSVPCLKSYLRDRETQVPYSVFYQDGRASTKRLRSLMDSDYFDHPKDEDILQELLDFSSGDSAIILDFFAGSCTTAQSVMALNSVDSGSRKFIMVQLPEPTDKPDYPTIADIGKERIRRAGKKILADNAGKDGIDRLDVGFKTFKLDSTNIKPWNIGFDQLESDLPLFADSLKDDRSAEDVLYEILLKYGLDLSLPITTHTLAGKTVYNIGMGALVVCLDQAITLDTVEGIAKLKDELQPETAMRVVFRDSGFADDVVKVNAVQILKQAGIEDVRSV